MIKDITRRDFLKGMAVGGVAAGSAGFLAACGSSSSSSSSTSSSESESSSSSESESSSSGATSADSQTAAEADTSSLSDTDIQDLIDSHTDENGKTFVSVSITDDPGTMNPYGSGSSKPRQVVLEGIFEGMFCIQGTGGEVAPVLAEGYEVSDDGLTYTITLKDYVYDQNGYPFTADDVVFTLETVARGEYSWTSMNYVEYVKALDDTTVEVKFTTTAQSRIINILIAYLFTEESYNESSDGMITTPVGTGPYAMTEWVSGSSMTFEYTEDYWETDTSKIVRNSYYNVDKINYKVIKEAAQRVIGLESGDLDMSTGVSSTDLGNFSDESQYNIFSTVQDQVVSIFFNCSENSPCQELEVRQAIAYAIDAQGVIDGVDQGNGQMCKAAWADMFPDFDEAWNDEDYYDYDMDKAIELLEAHGYGPSGETMEINIMYETNDRLASVAEVVQGYLLNVNINLTLFPCDGALFNTYKLDNTKADLLMATCGSSTFGASSLVGNLTASSDDNSLIGITDLELVDKIEQMNVNAYSDWSYAHELHYYVKDNCYLYCLYAPINFSVTTKVVTGFIMNQKGMDSPNCCTYIWNEE